MTLSRQDVAKVGLLARLALSSDDLDRMTGELSKIVGFVSQLEELDTPPSLRWPIRSTHKTSFATTCPAPR